jgi:hypothetical protein
MVAAGMSQYGRDLDRMKRGFHNTGSDLDRKYWIALGLYAVLAVLAWFTIGDSRVLVPWFDLSEGSIVTVSRPVQMRLLPLVVLGGFALKTILARHAEKIRRGGDGDGNSTPRSL